MKHRVAPYLTTIYILICNSVNLKVLGTIAFVAATVFILREH